MKNRLEHFLKKLFSYLAFKGLQINMTKCHLMVLGQQYLTGVTPKTLYIDVFDARICAENSIKLLGLVIDNKLSFESRLQTYCQNATRI